MTLAAKHLSMDAPFASNEENRLLDVLENEDLPAPDTTLMSESLREEVERARNNFV